MRSYTGAIVLVLYLTCFHNSASAAAANGVIEVNGHAEAAAAFSTVKVDPEVKNVTTSKPNPTSSTTPTPTTTTPSGTTTTPTKPSPPTTKPTTSTTASPTTLVPQPTTPTAPTTSKTPATTSKPTAAPNTTDVPAQSTTPSPQNKGRKFDGPSFIGGIVLACGLTAIGFVAFKFYKSRTERNYHTFNNQYI